MEMGSFIGKKKIWRDPRLYRLVLCRGREWMKCTNSSSDTLDALSNVTNKINWEKIFGQIYNDIFVRTNSMMVFGLWIIYFGRKKFTMCNELIMHLNFGGWRLSTHSILNQISTRRCFCICQRVRKCGSADNRLNELELVFFRFWFYAWFRNKTL